MSRSPEKWCLCAVQPEYLDELSAASRHSLELRGGPFDEHDASMFETLRHWRDAAASATTTTSARSRAAACRPSSRSARCSGRSGSREQRLLTPQEDLPRFLAGN